MRHAGIVRDGNQVEVKFRERETLDKARGIISDSNSGLGVTDRSDGADLKLSITLKPEFEREVLESALTQNMTYVKQLKDYETAVLEKRYAEMSPADRAKLEAEVMALNEKRAAASLEPPTQP